MKKTIFSLLLSALASASFAQLDTTAANPGMPDTSVPKKKSKASSYFYASLGFLSNAVYNGRKDTASNPYGTPALGYYHSSGLFVDGSFSWLIKAGRSRIDVFTAEAGYDFYFGNFDGELLASKYFYNSSSNNVTSQIKGSVSLSGGYDFSFIKPGFDLGLSIGDKTDYRLDLGLEHTFYGVKDKLQLTPTVMGSGSTQNYYSAYYNKRRVGGKRKNGGIVYDVNGSVEGAGRFKMLSYQFSLPVMYTCGKRLSLSIVLVYVLPVNPANFRVELSPQNGGNPVIRTSQETIDPSFYFSLSIGYKLRRK